MEHGDDAYDEGGDTVVATPRRGGAYRSALESRDLRLLFGALTVSVIGSWAYNVALVVLVYDRTHSAGWVGAVAFGRFVPALLFSSYAGVLAERFERTRVMLTSDLLCTLWMTLMATVALLDGPPALLLVLAALTSVSGSVYMPATSAMVPQVVQEKDLAAANALNASIDQLAVLVGPALAGALLVVVDPAVVVLGNGLTFLVSALLVRRLSVRSVPSDVQADGNALRQMLVGVKAIGSSTVAAVLVAFCVLASFVYGTDTVLFVLVSEDKLGTGAHGLGYLLAALGVGGLLGAPLVARLGASPRLGLVITVGMAVYCLPTALLSVVSHPGLAFALTVVRGAGTLVVDTLAVTALQRSLPNELIARVFGVFMALVLAATSLGALLTPVLVDQVGLDATLLVMGLAIPAACVLAYPLVAGIDREGAARLRELRPRIAVLEGLGIFSAANRATLERLASSAVEVLQPDVHRDVVVEGEAATALWVLVDGEVEVLSRGESRRTRRIRTMTGPCWFGEIGLLQGIPRTATVRTVTPSRFLRIDGDAFLAALVDTPASAALLTGMSSRLAVTHPSLRSADVPPQRGASTSTTPVP